MKKVVHLVIFIDALGWEIVNKFGFCDTLLPYRNKVKMQYGYSSTAIPTILTGKPPIAHKHLSFYYYNPENSPFKIFKYLPFKYLPSCIFDRWRVRHMLSKTLKRFLGYTGYFELYSMPYDRLHFFDYIEKKDIFIPGGLLPVRNLADELQMANKKYRISNWRLQADENIASMKNAMNRKKIEFGFLYIADLDGFLHMNICNDNKVASEIKRYEKIVEGMVDSASKNYDDYTVTVISDHGMTPLEKCVDLKAAIEDTGLDFGHDYIATYDSTMARFWFLENRARQIILYTLSQIPEGHTLSKPEKVKYGINFTDQMYGEEIFLLNSGNQIIPSDMGKNPLPGMHGFSPEDKHSYASCMSTHQLPFDPEWVGDFFNMMLEKVNIVTNKR
ncbi:MAG: hypothetical protein GY750_19615 [Lentisphaerae bacterium]|nr:hypothetical protein [Lentisphaerota bacterium]MCP4103606.1 hypothetical protein [Lentisphaerota bacterium]